MSPGPRRARWGVSDIPDQTGRTAVVTGANTGIGFETARVLAGRGANVVLACRNLQKAGAAADRIRADTGSDHVEVVVVDLSDLGSVRDAAAEIGQRFASIDLLINNAAVLWPPFPLTDQKIETQFATNHLGHFALTGLLLDRIMSTAGARIVNLGSLAHWRAREFDLTDLSLGRGDRGFEAYAQSKVALLLFMRELQRRLVQAGASAIAVAAHPGSSKTELVRRERSKAAKPFGGVRLWSLGQVQSPMMGALCPLRAATDPAVPGGAYLGPRGPFEFFGHPKLAARSSRRSRDPQLQRMVWDLSQELTGVHYDI